MVAHEDHEVMVFDVPACDGPVQMHGNGFPLHVGDQTIQAKESRVAETKRQGRYESSQALPEDLLTVIDLLGSRHAKSRFMG